MSDADGVPLVPAVLGIRVFSVFAETSRWMTSATVPVARCSTDVDRSTRDRGRGGREAVVLEGIFFV